MKLIVCAVLVLCLCTPARSQEKHRIADKKFWLLAALTVAATAVDSWSTQHQMAVCRARHVACAESNWFTGRNPSPARLWGTTMGITGGILAGSYFTKTLGADDGEEGDRYIWALTPVPTIIWHVYGAQHNLRLVIPRRAQTQTTNHAPGQLFRGR